MKPREFFIEDRLEKFRLESVCNLGESGVRNFDLDSLLNALDIPISSLGKIPLHDSPNSGRQDLREEIANLYDTNVTPDNILVTTGTSEALFILFNLLLEKGDQVSLFWPAFQALYEIPLMLGCKIDKIFPNQMNSEFAIQAKGLSHANFDIASNLNASISNVSNPNFSDQSSKKWNPNKASLGVTHLFKTKPKLAIINHPHNPTGYSMNDTDWKFLENYNEESFVIFDEHYRFLDFEKDLTRSGALMHPNFLATGSITKCFGVVGLKIGWIVAKENLIAQARSFKDYLTHTVNPISEFLALEILKQRKKIIEPIRNKVIDNIQYMRNNYHKIPSIEEYHEPSAGLVCFAKLQPGILSEKYADELYNNTGVFILPGKNFEEEGYIRIGFGEEPDRFRKGIDSWIQWENERSI
ncbi:pyridoxal phosphate-dependent aminotransferase [Leptospira sp. GIMC2001]|uniref:pyridoxal phosphate-dependent aminotransferase n=1 Tax=Leptospira sp. GIMC2001 TaxID=1513297 RepID=UPI00234A26E7|nr:pyridoxal phosphate-dependent aminotransferase [Leptospira sp. GIMC2001]WCL48632.1 pyridoxal phosphate-dependent aminotransferase [Leptospira sp. GIMC2001]